MRINEALHVNNSGRVPAQRKHPGNVSHYSTEAPLERQVSGPRSQSETTGGGDSKPQGQLWTQLLAATTVMSHGCLRAGVSHVWAPHCRVHRPFLINCVLQRGRETTALPSPTQKSTPRPATELSVCTPSKGTQGPGKEELKEDPIARQHAGVWEARGRRSVTALRSLPVACPF